jgi:hypothetical protein
MNRNLNQGQALITASFEQRSTLERAIENLLANEFESRSISSIMDAGNGRSEGGFVLSVAVKDDFWAQRAWNILETCRASHIHFSGESSPMTAAVLSKIPTVTHPWAGLEY